jgi:hypothetical protein
VSTINAFCDAASDQLCELLQPDSLAVRLEILDEFDRVPGGLEPGAWRIGPHADSMAQAWAIKEQFETANRSVYAAARADIVASGSTRLLRRCMRELNGSRAKQGVIPGLSFDLLDEIVCGVLQLGEPGDGPALPSFEMKAYQPTPARHVFDLLEVCRLSDRDTFVDLGSGLGHVPLLISIMTGVRTFGVEVQANLAASAQRAAQQLGLRGVHFLAEDARTADLSSGSVFYLFSPFSGLILENVLERLRGESIARPIRICGLGPCVWVLREQTWLRANDFCGSERITVFQSQ